MRFRHTLAVVAVTLVSVSLGASASAAPQHQKAPTRQPIVVVHAMSSCGHMDGY